MASDVVVQLLAFRYGGCYTQTQTTHIHRQVYTHHLLVSGCADCRLRRPHLCDARDKTQCMCVCVCVCRYHDTLNAPTQLQSAYFTFQFYHFPPTTSDMAFLVQVCVCVCLRVYRVSRIHACGPYPTTQLSACAFAGYLLLNTQ